MGWWFASRTDRTLRDCPAGEAVASILATGQLPTGESVVLTIPIDVQSVGLFDTTPEALVFDRNGSSTETLTIRSPASSPLRRVEYRGPECFRVSSEITAGGLRASLRVTATPEAGEWEDRPKEISFQVMTESGSHAVLIPCHFF